MADFQLPLSYQDDPALERIHHDLRFVVEAVQNIAANLPVQRRELADATKAIHIRVTWERRNGYCPCCQRTRVCDGGGKFPGAQFDHWYGRFRNASSETWLVCGECNRALERPEFKTAARSAFEAYQQAVEVVTARQKGLFESLENYT